MCHNNIEKIEKENWRKAKGIKGRTIKSNTNSALAERDYSLKCHAPNLIAEVQGYFLWWCSTHHQPLAWCEKSKLRFSITNKLKEIIKEE